MSTTINRKINHIFILMEKLAEGIELYPQDERLQNELFSEEDKALKNSQKANERTLRRYLEDIHQLYPHIVVTEKKTKEFSDRKVMVYRVSNKRDISKVLKFFMEQKNDISWILQMLHEQDPTLIHELEADTRETIENELKADQEIFLFNNPPFELFTQEKDKKHFAILKQAVKNREYRNFVYINHRSEDENIVDAKCLKMIYTQSNWYVGIETKEGTFRLLRLRFIQEIRYSQKVGYQKCVLEKYKEYFEHFENALSLAGVPRETAILRASCDVALYFEQDMKKFFKSQEFLRKNVDGSVEFSVKFTQPMEILPFIKQWLPDIEIVSPPALQEVLLKDLSKSINMYGL